MVFEVQLSKYSFRSTVFEVRCSKHSGTVSSKYGLVRTTVVRFDFAANNCASNETALRTKPRFEINQISHVVFVRSAVLFEAQFCSKHYTAFEARFCSKHGVLIS